MESGGLALVVMSNGVELLRGRYVTRTVAFIGNLTHLVMNIF